MKTTKSRALAICLTLLFAIGLILPSVTTSASAQANNGGAAWNKWAVVIGIGRVWGENLGADDDAKLMSQILKNTNGFPTQNVKLLLNTAATTANIVQAIKWLETNVKQASTVVFFFSGHGSNGAIATYDGALTGSYLQTLLGDMQPSKFALIVAACYSGSMIPYLEGPGRIVVTSATATNPAADSGHYSLFGARFIRDGMKNKLADANGDGSVSIQEAHYYAEIGLMSDNYGQEMTL